MARELYTARLDCKDCISDFAQCYHFEFVLDELESFSFTAGQFVSASTAGVTAAAADAAAKMKQDMRVSLVNSPAAEAYPIAGFTYLLLYQEQPDRGKGETLARFLQWAIADGQKDAEPLGYASLPSAVAELDKAVIASLTFQGKPLGAGK